MYRHSFYPLFFLTILMVAVGQMTQTLYVPSIPMMAGDFHVASGQLQAGSDGLRASVGTQATAALQSAVEQLESRRVKIALATALQRDDTDAASKLITDGWKGVEAVEWHDPGLETGYADPKAFGYGKLGVLELALQDNASRAAVVMDAGGPRLALAAPVLAEGRVLSVVYVRLPLETVVGPLQSAQLSDDAYLALRQGRHNVFQRGDLALASSAEFGAVPVAGTRMRVVAAAPASSGGMLTNFLLAGLGLLVAAGLLLQPHLKLRRKSGDDEADEVPVGNAPTLAELQASGQVKPPEPKADAVARPVPPPPMESAARAVLDRSIFRAYDIRGVVGSELTARTAALISAARARWKCWRKSTSPTSATSCRAACR